VGPGGGGGGGHRPQTVPPKCCAGSQIFDAWFNDGKTVSTSRQRSETAREMLLYLLKFPIPQWWKTGNNPQSVSGTGSLSKVNQFLQLVVVGPIITPRFTEIGWLLLQWSSSQTDRHLTDRHERMTNNNDRITPPSRSNYVFHTDTSLTFISLELIN